MATDGYIVAGVVAGTATATVVGTHLVLDGFPPVLAAITGVSAGIIGGWVWPLTLCAGVLYVPLKAIAIIARR